MDFRKINSSGMDLIFILALLGGTIAFMVFVLLPMVHRVSDLTSQNRMMTDEIKLVSNFFKTKGSDSIRGQLVSPSEVSPALEEIAVLGNRHTITFLSIVRQDKGKPSGKNGKNGKKSDASLPIQLETLSNYKQLGLFLGGLNDLSQSVVLVDNFQIIRDKGEPDKVRSKINMHICLKSEGHGQE